MYNLRLLMLNYPISVTRLNCNYKIELQLQNTYNGDIYGWTYGHN